MITRTIGKLHFDDLDPNEFEMLTMKIVKRMRQWERVEHAGAAGADKGIDIRAIEKREDGMEVSHHFQCKRYKSISPSQIKKIIKNYCEKNQNRPVVYYIVCGCIVSDKSIETFKNECEANNITAGEIWSSSYLEALLYNDYPDLLSAYFGNNNEKEHDDQVSAVQRNIAIKKKMHKDFIKPDLIKKEDPRMISKEPWRKFRWSKVLVRSIHDKSYPEVNSSHQSKGDWYPAEVYDWYHNGLMVLAFPYTVDAVVKFEKPLAIVDPDNSENYEIHTVRLLKAGCIPFENIIDYDLDGDEFYRFPHLYCDFINGFDPYEKIIYFDEQNRQIDEKQILEIRYS